MASWWGRPWHKMHWAHTSYVVLESYLNSLCLSCPLCRMGIWMSILQSVLKVRNMWNMIRVVATWYVVDIFVTIRRIMLLSMYTLGLSLHLTSFEKCFPNTQVYTLGALWEHPVLHVFQILLHNEIIHLPHWPVSSLRAAICLVHWHILDHLRQGFPTPRPPVASMTC